jgi:hypothetical protein
MDGSIKTNRLAIVSFASGLIAILSIGLIFALYNLQETTGGIIISITDGIIMPLRNLCVIVALVTGILALRQIKKKGGTEKGKILAWIGIVLSAGWIIFGLIVGMTFLLAEILH